jgi:subtilase family serine protease
MLTTRTPQRKTSTVKRLSQRNKTSLTVEQLEGRSLLATGLATYYHMLVPNGSANPYGSPAPVGLTPSQIRLAYGFNSINFNGIVGDGTGQTIAIVDAYDDPAFVNSTSSSFVNSDLHKFDVAFGIADPPSFVKVNQSGGSTMPPSNTGWAGEIALDVEWAHALAPKANIVLVEANSNSYTDLFAAVNYAKSRAGVSVISMSWGGGEFSSETSYDSTFTTPSGHQGVTFVASTGDSGSPSGYPALSPRVVAVGGTRLFINSSGYVSENGWSGSGGGISTYENKPAYQSSVTQSSTRRTAPDVAFDADPNSGVAVYDSFGNGSTAPWVQVGGTSFSAPAWGALIAIADQGRVLAGQGTLDGFSQTLPKLYSLSSADFHDVTTGSNGGFSAGAGYDLVTGRGSPIANLVAKDLVDGGGGGGSGQNGPRITAATPSGTVSGAVTSVVVTFDRAINPTTFTTADITFTGPSGTITITSITPVTGSNNTQFLIAFASQTQAGTYTMTLGPDIRDASGLMMDQNQNGIAGESSDTYTDTFGISNTTTFSATGLPKGIYDFQDTVSTITVPGNYLITKLTVQLNISHTWDADLYIWLVSPSGQTVVLSANNGGSGDNYTNTIFDSTAATSIDFGVAPFAGAYRPEQSLSVFNGKNAKGTWTLVVEDQGYLDQGKLNAWSLIIQGVAGDGSGSPAARSNTSSDTALNLWLSLPGRHDAAIQGLLGSSQTTTTLGASSNLRATLPMGGFTLPGIANNLSLGGITSVVGGVPRQEATDLEQLIAEIWNTIRGLDRLFE